MLMIVFMDLGWVAGCLCLLRLFRGAPKRLTMRISDPAPGTFAMEPRRYRGVHCIRLVRRSSSKFRSKCPSERPQQA